MAQAQFPRRISDHDEYLYRKGSDLGAGSWGKVYKVTNKKNQVKLPTRTSNSSQSSLQRVTLTRTLLLL